ncbi:hypothetical protein D3C80_1101200 [compost metagenome]
MLGEIGGADRVGLVNDVLLMAGKQWTQHQLVGRRTDHREVRERLAGHLRDSFARYQRINLQTIGHARGCAQHHPLENNAHVAVVDLAQQLAHHFLKRNADEQHAL